MGTRTRTRLGSVLGEDGTRAERREDSVGLTTDELDGVEAGAVVFTTGTICFHLQVTDNPIPYSFDICQSGPLRFVRTRVAYLASRATPASYELSDSHGGVGQTSSRLITQHPLRTALPLIQQHTSTRCSSRGCRSEERGLG